jgi:sec-independent protein translocase protein TatB
MFDIGALELLIIGVVALIVVGPERLPRLARTAGLWVGRARRALSSVKEEIDREIKADELREILRKQSQSRPLDTIIEESTGLSGQKRGAGDTAGQGSSGHSSTSPPAASTQATGSGTGSSAPTSGEVAAAGRGRARDPGTSNGASNGTSGDRTSV